jgi:polysaccharide pyruvyl transferase WcaK-like protein
VLHVRDARRGARHHAPVLGKVLILAGDTDGNLGDLAIVTATCDALRGACPGIEIALVTSRPGRDRQRLGILPVRRGFRGLGELIGAARRADLVICGGGGLFQDDDSLLKMPYWALRLIGLRLVNDRIAGLSIGAGPLDHPLSRAFARLALSVLDPVSVRDPPAQETLAPLTKQPVEVVPDPAFLLEPASRSDAEQALRDANVPRGPAPLIGVALRRWFHKNSSLVPHKHAARLGLAVNRGAKEMARFTGNVAAVLDAVAARTGCHVVFMPTYNVAHEDDRAVCDAVAAKMRSASVSMLELDDPKLYAAVAGLLAAMLAGRMHAAILAAARGTPIVGIAYNPKFRGMLELLGQPDRCLPIETFAEDRQPERAIAMLSEAVDAPARLRPDTAALAGSTRRFIERLALRSPATERP